MGVDNQSDFKPPAPENAKTAGTKSPETKPASEFISTVRQKVKSILNRWKGGHHSQEIFQDLGSIEIPQDQNPELPPSVDQPSEIANQDTHHHLETVTVTPDIVQQDQKEISALTQEIQQLQTESLPAPESASKKLFPDRPSLYAQHHQEYDQERKTVKGEIARLKDIVELKMAGVKKAAYTYDGLRSRGINRDQIMKNDTGEFPRISQTLIDNWGSDSKEYQRIHFYTDLPKNIDRLYSIGEFDLDSFSSDEKFSSTKMVASILSHQTDEQFQQTREKLNNFPFLSGSYTLRFFFNKELSPDTFDALSYLKKEYFSDPQNEAKIELFSSKGYLSKDDLFSGLTHEGYSDGVTKLVKTLISSGVNGDKKIEIPSELLKFSREDESEFLHCLSGLKDRDEQNFLVGKMRFSNREEDLISHYFDNHHQPKFDFYRDFISSSEPSNTAVAIPSRVLESIEDQESRSFFEVVSGLPERQFQKYFLNLKDKGHNPSDYIYNGKIDFSFYRTLLCDQNIDAKPIPIEHLSHLPEDQQRLISLTSRMTALHPVNAAESRELIFRNYRNFDLFFDKKNQLTSYFFETCAQQHQSPLSDTEVLKSNLTPELLATFSPEDQKLWNIIFSFKNADMRLSAFVVNNRQQFDVFFDSESKPTSLFFKTLVAKTYFQDLSNSSFIRSNLVPELISTFSSDDQLLWNGVLGMKNIDTSTLKLIIEKYSQTDLYFNQSNQPTSLLFESLIKDKNNQLTLTNFDILRPNLTPETLSTFSPEDQKFWSGILALKSLDPVSLGLIINHKNRDVVKQYFNNQNQPTSFFFKDLIQINSESKNSAIFDILKSNLTPEALSTFSPEDQKLFGFILGLEYKNKSEIINFLFAKGENPNRYIDNNSLNIFFYKEFAQQYPSSFIDFFSKEDWRFAFGNDTVDDLLNALPKSTDEKRNAFTHNEYDRTTQFFQFLIRDQNSGFKFDSTHIKIATDYIKNYGLSRSLLFYNYFQKVSLYEQGLITSLPPEISASRIFSREDLRREIRDTQKKCFGAKPLTDINNLSPFQLNLLSIATGHSVNRWTRIPIERITADFSQDLANGYIAPLSPEFHSESISSSSVKVETEQKFSEVKNLALIKQEILSSIDEKEDISFEKTDLLNILSPKLTSLSEKIQTIPESKRQFIQKQIDAYKQQIDLVSGSGSIDTLLSNLIAFNINLGETQDQFNSILRRLVFKKVFLKHQESPHWQEDIKYSLEKDDTVSAVNNVLNLLNNTIKDHALNFESKNQDGYWSESTFEAMKKYSSVFKKNLSLPTFINDLQTLKENFVVTQLDINQTVKLIPDRGLVGEMSGYMADVCYTKVYPLLKQYPGLVPYKFVSNPESENPEFIGSTLVFQVEDADNQPVFLIRAFDIPQEQSINIGDFFETFVNHLSSIAKKVGIKKIITAGTSGTISNYPTTNNYVINKYVKDRENVPLKNNFNFNGYDITNQCYLVRDLS